MVRLMLYDSEAPVYLLQQDNSHHLMREGHGGEGKLEIGASAHFRGKTQGASDDEDYTAPSLYAKGFDFGSQLLGGQGFPLDFKGDNVVRGPDPAQDIFSFGNLHRFLVGSGGIGSQRALSKLDDVQGTIAAQSF